MMYTTDVRLASPQGPTAISSFGTPMASTQPLAAPQGYPWDEAVRTGRMMLSINDIRTRFSLKRMNIQMKGFRDSMFRPKVLGIIPVPTRPLRDSPFRDISDVEGWQGYISNHEERDFIVGPGIVWAGYVAILDEDDHNHHANVVDLLLVCSDGTIVRMHPRVAATSAPIRIGRFDGYFQEFVEYAWSNSKVRPPPGIGRSAQPIATSQTLASPQGASSSTEARPAPPPLPRPMKAPPMPPPPRQPWAPPVPQGAPPPAVLVTNGVVAVLTCQSAIPSAAVPVYFVKDCPASHAAIASVPQPWVPYHCPHSMRIWIHNPVINTWAWWEHSSPVAQ